MNIHSEFERWKEWMKSCRGKWILDGIHNGVDRDMLVYCRGRYDDTRGVYIEASGPTIIAGYYEGGGSDISEALFHPVWGVSTLDFKGRYYPGVAAPPFPAMQQLLRRINF